MITEHKLIKLIKEEEGPELDYKGDLVLEGDGDKAQFVKDVLALANNGGKTRIITGVEDKTRKLVGIKTSHTPEQLNEILKDKCDPPLHIEYLEKVIMGYKIGVIEIKGSNPRTSLRFTTSTVVLFLVHKSLSSLSAAPFSLGTSI